MTRFVTVKISGDRDALPRLLNALWRFGAQELRSYEWIDVKSEPGPNPAPEIPLGDQIDGAMRKLRSLAELINGRKA